jgi:hypothetical protein
MNKNYRYSANNLLQHSYGIIIQLTMVRDSLTIDSNFIDYYSLLPPVKPKFNQEKK